jgi:hypothetical protein
MLNSHPDLALRDNFFGQQDAHSPSLIFLEFLTIKASHEFDAWKETQKQRIKAKSFICNLNHVALLPHSVGSLPDSEVSTLLQPGIQIIGAAVGTAKQMVLGTHQQAIQDTFGPYHIEAMDALREVDFLRFEEFLTSLNSVYIRIVAEMESLLATEIAKAQNYEELSFSFGQLKKVNSAKVQEEQD